MDPVRTGAGQFTLGKFDVGGTLLFPTGGSRGGRQAKSKNDSRDGKNVDFFRESHQLIRHSCFTFLLILTRLLKLFAVIDFIFGKFKNQHAKSK